VKPLPDGRKALIERYMTDAAETQPRHEAPQEPRNGQTRIEQASVARLRNQDQPAGAPKGSTETASSPPVERTEPDLPTRGDRQERVRALSSEKGSVAGSGGLAGVGRGSDLFEGASDESLAPDDARAEALESIEAELRRRTTPGRPATVRRVQRWEIQPDGATLLVEEVITESQGGAAQLPRLDDEWNERPLPTLEGSVASDDSDGGNLHGVGSPGFALPPEPPRAAQDGRTIADAVLPTQRVAESAAGSEACQVELWRGYVSASFYVRVGKRDLLESRRFRLRGSAAPPDAGPARAAYDDLVSRLAVRGWQTHAPGREWFATVFVRDSPAN
jgi:hypothetical protein